MMNHHDDSLLRPLGAAFLCALVLGLPACSKGGGPDHDGDSHEDGSGHDDHGDDHGDEHGDEHDEETVELAAAQIEAAGIRVEPASAGEVARYLRMPAVVAADADAVTHVNPKAPGIVRSIHTYLGQGVEPGALLCVIDSVELGSAVAAFVRARALVEAAQTTLERETQLYAGRLETAVRVLDGAIEVNRKIHAREEELQRKAVSTIRPLLEADKALQASILQKERELTDLRAERDARLLELEVGLTERRIGRDAASNALLALGVDPRLLEELEPGSPLFAGTYEIRAPRSGIVSGRHITVGEYVDSTTKLFTLEDLSRVWVVASVFEEQIQSVRIGQVGHIRLDAFPGQVIRGQVTLIGYEVDRESRALGLRLELENPTLESWPEDYPLRPGMFGNVQLEVERKQASIVLPESAIVHEDDGDYVFVQEAPGTFERRRIEIGLESLDAVEVLAGIEPGEAVAVSGTFQLKSTLRKGELGSGHSH